MVSAIDELKSYIENLRNDIVEMKSSMSAIETNIMWIRETHTKYGKELDFLHGKINKTNVKLYYVAGALSIITIILTSKIINLW